MAVYVADLVIRSIVKFRRNYPNITFDLLISGANGIVSAVQGGRADIGLAYMPELTPEVESALSIKAPLLAIMAPDYPLATKSRISFKEALAHPLALPERGFGIRQGFMSNRSRLRIV
jgi:DNA-binding transcriptional LysR family regulator